MEAVLDLLMTIEAGNGNPAKVRFEEWVRQTQKDSDILPILLENRWNAGNGFTDWLEDATIFTDDKGELLQRMVVEKVHEWVGLLRRQPEESKAVIFVATYLSAPLLLQSVAQADFRQAAVLSETIEWLQCKADGIPFLTGNDRLFSTALSEALLFFMQDRDTLGGRSLTEKEVVKKFLAHLYFVYTGKTDFQSDAEWTNLSVNLAVDLEMEAWQDVREAEFADVLLQKNISNTIFSHHVVSVLEKYPEKFLAWLEKDADLVLIKRIVDVDEFLESIHKELFAEWADNIPVSDAKYKVQLLYVSKLARLLDRSEKITSSRLLVSIMQALNRIKEESLDYSHKITDPVSKKRAMFLVDSILF